MPKYLIIGLLVVIVTFVIMNNWPKLQERTKNKVIGSIFVFIAIGFVVLISILMF